MNSGFTTQKSARRMSHGLAERSAGRGPAGAHSLGRVEPAVWTTAGLASAASPAGQASWGWLCPCRLRWTLRPARSPERRAGRTPEAEFLTHDECIHRRKHADLFGGGNECTANLYQGAVYRRFPTQLSGARSHRHDSRRSHRIWWSSIAGESR